MDYDLEAAFDAVAGPAPQVSPAEPPPPVTAPKPAYDLEAEFDRVVGPQEAAPTDPNKVFYSLTDAAKSNPDEAARRDAIAKQLDTDPALLPPLPEAEAMLKRKEIQTAAPDIVQNSPITAKWLLTGNHAKIAGLGLAGLQKMESTFSDFGYISKALQSGLASGSASFAKLADTLASSVYQQVFSGYEALKAKHREDAGLAKEPPTDTLLGGFARSEQRRSDALMEGLTPEQRSDHGQKEYFTTDQAKAAYRDPVKMLGDTLRSLPSSALMVAAAVATRGAALEARIASLAESTAAGLTESVAAEAATKAAIAAGMKTMSVFSGLSSAALSYSQTSLSTAAEVEKMAYDKIVNSPTLQRYLKLGYGPEAAQALTAHQAGEEAGLKAGALTGLLEFFGGKITGKLMSEGGGFFPRLGKGMATGAAVETPQSYFEQVAANVAIKEHADPTRTWDAGAAEAGAQGFFLGPLMEGPIAAFAGKHSQATQAKTDHAALNTMAEQAAENPIRDRSPDAFRDFVNTMTDGGQLNEVFVDTNTLGEVFAQSGVNSKELESVLPDVAAQMNDETNAEGYVRISTADLLSKVKSPDILKSILDNAKTNPDGMTFVDSEAFFQKQHENFTKEAEIAASAKTVRDQHEKDVREIRQKITDEIAATGRYDRSVAASNAIPLAAFYVEHAKRFGMTPKEMFEQYPYRARRGEVQGLTLDEDYAQTGVPNQPVSAVETPDKKFIAVTEDDKGVKYRLMLGENDTHEWVPIDFDLAKFKPLIFGGRPFRPAVFNTEAEAQSATKTKPFKVTPKSTNNVQSSNAEFRPSNLMTTFYEGANLSSVIHEAGHFYLEVLEQLASRPDAPQTVVDDYNKIMDWFGVTPEAWAAMSGEERTPLHEQFAESQELWMLEGKSPTLDMQAVFSRFRRWMLDVYKSAKDFLRQNPGAGKLNDEVRAVFDRLIASEEAIKETEAVRGYVPLFQTAEQAGLSEAAFKAYIAEHEKATDGAVETLQKRSMRDMKWLNNARSKVLKGIQAKAKDARDAIREEVTVEVMSEPINQVRQFLRTGELDTGGSKTNTFTTAKGSSYVVHEDGTTTRTKAARSDVGHEGDSGLKERSERTVYLSSEAASRLAIPSETNWRVVEHKDGTFSLAVKNQNGKWGISPSAKNVSINTEPTGGSIPLELWGKETLNGLPSYKKVHFGNAIVKSATNQTTTADNFKLNTEAVKDIATDGKVPPQLKSMVAPDGLHPDAVAAMFDFPSGDALFWNLTKAENAQEKINGITDQRMLERHGEMIDARAIEEAANAAVVNEARTRFLATGLRILTKSNIPVSQLTKAARLAAEEAIAKIRVKDLRPNQYAAAERKANKDALRFAVKDPAAAIRAQRAALLNNQLYKVAVDVQEEINSDLARMKRITKPAAQKAMGGEHLLQLNALLDRFGVNSKQSLTAMDKRLDLKDYLHLESARLSAIAPNVPDWIASEQVSQDYQTLSLTEFRELMDAVKSIELLARRERNQYMAIRQQTFQEEKASILGRLRQFHPEHFTVDGKPKVTIAPPRPGTEDEGKYAALVMNAETIVNVLEGGEFGELHESILGRLSARSDWKATRMEDIYAFIKPLFGKYNVLERRAFSRDDIGTKTLGFYLTREHAVSTTLLHGSKEGRDRLAVYGWNLATQEKIIDLLDPRDVDLVNGIWQLFDDSLWPELKALDERTQGKAAPKVEAIPHTAKGGALKGGYFKIKYVSAISTDPRTGPDAIKEIMEGRSSARASTPQSSSIAREDHVEKPPRLDIGVLFETVNEVVHDLAFREAVADTLRVLTDRDVQMSIKTVASPKEYDALIARVGNVAMREHHPNGPFEKYLTGARKNTVVVLMSGMYTALQNYLGFAPIAERLSEQIGVKGVANVALEIFRMHSPLGPSAYRFAVKNSHYLRNRHFSFDRSLQEEAQRLTFKEPLMPAMSVWLWAVGKTDQIVSAIGWNAAYKTGMEVYGNSHDKSVLYADHVVRQTLGSGRELDISQMQEGPYRQMLTMFYSNASAQLNMQIRAGSMAKREWNAGQRLKAVTRIMKSTALIVLIPAIMSDLAITLLRGDATDDDEDWFGRFARDAGLYQLSFIPGLREFGPYFWRKFDPDLAHYGFKITPIESAFTGVGAALSSAGDIYKDEGDVKDTGDVIMGLGYAFGLPGLMVKNAVVGTGAWLNDEAGPEAILFGPPKERK